MLITVQSGVQMLEQGLCLLSHAGDGTRVPLTEICLLPAEFDEYQIGVDASVTFCLKELRVSDVLQDGLTRWLFQHRTSHSTGNSPVHRCYQPQFISAV